MWSMLVVACVLASVDAPGPAGVSLESLLTEMTDRAAIARWPEPAYTCRQASSYDRKSVTPSDAKGWFANADHGQFLRVEEREGTKEYIMHDADGPGAVVRLWSANPDGVMRVYIDGGVTPVIEAPMADVLRGRWKVGGALAGERARGCTLYLPIPYAKHCKITSDKGGFYYQVNYRTYAAGTSVESLDERAIERCRASIEKTVAEFEARNTVQAGLLFRDITVSPGAKETASFPQGPGAVSRLFLSVNAPDREQALRSTIVRMEFDGEETVWCPAGDLFGLGPGAREYRTWWLRTGDDGFMRIAFPMPFAKSASITIENLGAQPVTISAHFGGMDWTWDDRSMHFHAAWHDQYPIHTRPMQDWNYVAIEGSGVYVGDSLSLMNPVKDWWGEGDEKIYVDGEEFPSHFGTGTEDYYGYAWSSPQTFSGPFNAQPRSDGEKLGNNWGRSTVNRTRSLDAIPFSRSLRFDMEIWHWTECDVEYAATTYFYARPGAKTNRAPEPENASRALVSPPPLPPPYRVKGAIECENLIPIAKSESVDAEPQGGFQEGLWSDQQHLWIRAKKKGDFVELRIPAPDAAPRRLIIYATKSWDYAIVQFSVNGAPAGAPIDLCSGQNRVLATGPVDLGEFTPRDGAFVLRAEVAGASEKAVPPRTYFGLDCVVLSAPDGAK